MSWMLGLLVLSSLPAAWGVSVFIAAYQKRRELLGGGKFRTIHELRDAGEDFPRGVFRMSGKTGGPVPFKAPLSGRDCYYYELVLCPHGTKAEIRLMERGTRFLFYSPKGAVTLDPVGLSRDSLVSQTVDHWTRIPLPLDLRKKLQNLNAGDGKLIERIIPALQEIQLVSRVHQTGPRLWKLKRGPGLFPLISAHPEPVTGVRAARAEVLPLRRALLAAASLGLALIVFYFARSLLLMSST